MNEKKIVVKVQRVGYRQHYTMGHLYVDDVYECDTLEPCWRDYANGEEKVKGESAIPEGTYRMIMRSGGRHGFTVPQLCRVPYFTGVQIHPGNTWKDTLGCILVGKNKKPGKVLDSRVTFSKLFDKLWKAHMNGYEMEIIVEQKYKKGEL